MRQVLAECPNHIALDLTLNDAPAPRLRSALALSRGNWWLTRASGVVLDKVVEYFHYWYRYRNSEDVPDMDIPVEICLELLAAADYLGLDQ